MSTLAERFQHTISRAEQLNPSAIRIAICADPVDNGLRAATYEARTTNGGLPTSPQDRRIEYPRIKSITRHLRHIEDLEDAQDRFLDSISELNAEVRDKGTADTWQHAIAHALAMLPMITAAADVGRNIDKPITTAEEAVRDVQYIADRYLPHAPRPIDSARSDHWCRNHLIYGITRKRATRLLCDWCYSQVRDLERLGDPVELQLDPTLWPPENMVRANEDGRRKDLSLHRRDWLVSLGLNPALRLRSA